MFQKDMEQPCDSGYGSEEGETDETDEEVLIRILNSTLLDSGVETCNCFHNILNI